MQTAAASLAALLGAGIVTTTVLAAGKPADAGHALSSAEGPLLGFTLANDLLRVRVVGNSERFFPLSDTVQPGLNGLAALIHAGQGRNIFTPAGLNYECCHTVPKMGQQADLWNAPRVAPMAIEQVDPRTVRLTQKGADASGLNTEIVFHLGENYVDQTITFWPDVDIESSDSFWASYLNLVQNPSLYLRGALRGEPEAKWLEMTSAGHNRGGNADLFFRPCDPTGKAWHQFLTDNPVRRQAVYETPASRAATEGAGFKLGEVASFDNFFFGFVDDYVALWIFRTPENGRFYPWISASGGETVRRPAWDFGIASGPQKAGERRSFFVRLVYKPFAGVDDVLKEVERFQAPRTATGAR